MRTVFVTFLMLLVAAAAVAGPPINGTYQSQTLGGTMLDGRFSESWTAPNGHLMPGNTTNKLSWNGATLGTEWWMYCTEIVSSFLLTNTVNPLTGNGTKEWFVSYKDGFCILDGNGPWGNGSEPSYLALYDSYTEIKTFQFTNFQITGVVNTVSLQASFVGFSSACMTFSISNQQQLGSTDSGPLPANYPGFMAPLICAATRTMGTWGETDDFTLIVTDCTVPVEQKTWGGIKSLYND